MLRNHRHKGGSGRCSQAQETHKSISNVLNVDIVELRWKEVAVCRMVHTGRFCLVALIVETVPFLLRQPVLAILIRQIRGSIIQA